MKSIVLDICDPEEEKDSHILPRPQTPVSTENRVRKHSGDSNCSEKSEEAFHTMTIGQTVEETSVEDLIKGVKSCTLDHVTEKPLKDGPVEKSPELSDALGKLTIEDSATAQKKNTVLDKEKAPENEKPCRSQPQEDDERAESWPETDQGVTSNVPEKKHSQLVELQAPTVFPEEEREGEEEESKEKEELGERAGETDESLEERGPMLGVAPQNYHHQHPHMGQKSYIPYGEMPANFPVYGYQEKGHGPANNFNTTGKRCMEVQEMFHEPPKFTRPQNADPSLVQAMGGRVVNNLNNLNAPAAPLVIEGKKTSRVYPRQLSGGTVYTPETSVLTPPNLGDADYPGSIQHDGESLSSLEFPSFNITVEEEMNVLDEILNQVGENELDPGLMGQEQVQMKASPQYGQLAPQLQQPLQQQQVFQQQEPLPPMTSLARPAMYQYPKNQQQPTGGLVQQQQQFLQQQRQQVLHQQQLQHQQKQPQLQRQTFQQPDSHHQQRPTRPPSYQQYPSPHGSLAQFSPNVEDNGYSSDLSPSHEPQMSPDPGMSPDRSQGVPSPAMSYHSNSYMSPPHNNYSPPPSNMSVSSHDSGVGSPMSEQGTSQDGTDYSPYIDTHLEELNDALATASKDLLEMRTKATYHKQRQAVQPAAVNGVQRKAEVPRAPPSVAPHRAANPPVMGMVAPQPQQVPPQSGPHMVQSPPHQAEVPFTAMPTTVSDVLGSNPAGKPKDAVISAPSNKLTSAVVAPRAVQPQQIGKVPSPQQQQAVPPPPAYPPQQPTTAQQPPPQVNKDGKIAIPPIHKPKPVPVVPVMVPVTAVPVIIMPPVTPAKQPPRYTPIAPRRDSPTTQAAPNARPGQVTGNQAPARPAEDPARAGNNRQARPCNGGAPAPAPQNGERVTNNGRDRLLNLARRLVADMKRNDLVYIDNEGDTYLHVAVCQADGFMVQALLERLEREKLTNMQDMQNVMGQTPLYLAVSTNHPEMVQLLVDYKADTNKLAKCELPSGDIEQTAAIHSAASKGEKYLKTLLALLKSSNMDLELANSDGHTALHCAILAHGKTLCEGREAPASINSIPIIKALLEHGANPNQEVPKSGRTALMYALESHDLDLIESTFQAVNPVKLPGYLKTQAFDNNTCLKIADSFKQKLSVADQQRLTSCLRPQRGTISSMSPISSSVSSSSPMSCFSNSP